MSGPYPPNNNNGGGGGGQLPKRPKVSTPGPPTQPPLAEPVSSSQAPAPPVYSLVDQDLDSTPTNYKRQGEDWFAIFNHNVPRLLDVSILHTFEHPSVVCCVRFSADGKYIATGCNKSAQIFDVKTGAKVVTLVDENAEREGDLYIRSVCFSPDGRYLATGAEDKIIRIWDIQRKKIKNQFLGHEQDIYSLDFSRDGTRLASGSGDRTARLWDMETGQNLLTLSIEDGVTTVAVSPDGKFLAAGSLDRAVRVWDTEKGSLVERLEGHKDSVYSVAFSPSGLELLSGSLDKTIKLWELTAPRTTGSMYPAAPRAGTCKTTFVGHKDFVLSVALSPDGKWVVSGSKDRGVQFWNPVDGQPQFMLQGHKNSGTSRTISRMSVDVSDFGCTRSYSGWETICYWEWRLQSSYLELRVEAASVVVVSWKMQYKDRGGAQDSGIASFDAGERVIWNGRNEVWLRFSHTEIGLVVLCLVE